MTAIGILATLFSFFFCPSFWLLLDWDLLFGSSHCRSVGRPWLCKVASNSRPAIASFASINCQSGSVSRRIRNHSERPSSQVQRLYSDTLVGYRSCHIVVVLFFSSGKCCPGRRRGIFLKVNYLVWRKKSITTTTTGEYYDGNRRGTRSSDGSTFKTRFRLV